MNRETIIPTDKENWLKLRTQDITSTDVAALFGISPYLTQYELWHRKKNASIMALEQNPRMVWGNRLQDAIANGIAEDYDLIIRPMNEYIRIPSFRMGSSFDYAIEKPSEPLGILEVKNVDSLAYKDGWLIDGTNVEAPPHIELQVQYQLLVSGRSYAYIGALIGGNRVTIIKREPDQEIYKAIQAKVAAFWESIDADNEPEPNFKEDYGFISKLNGYAEPGKIITVGNDPKISGLVRDYKEWGEKESSAKAEKDAIKAQLLLLIENAEKVIGDGFMILAGVKPPTMIEAYERKGYRDFKVYLKNKKEN